MPPENDDIEISRVIPGHVSVREAIDELVVIDPWVWSLRKRRIKGTPAFFDNRIKLAKTTDPDKYQLELAKHRPFLIQPLRDRHKHKVSQKGRQTGMSENMLTEELWYLDSHPRTKAVHTFPRFGQMSDFVTTRINVIKDESPAGKALFGIPNTVMTKRIGKDSFLLLRSAWESNLGEGIDADMLVLDEKDRMKEGIDIAFKESLSGGGAGLIREISTPTLPDKGINELYLKSDQHEWHVRCERCGLEQTIEYPDNMIQVKDFSEGCQDLPKGAYEYACRKLSCRGPLNRLDGRWVAKYPEKTVIRGYFIPQLIAPWISATDVMQKKITYRFLQPWQNYVLGKTSLGESTLLTDADADRSTSNYQLLHGRSSAWKNISVGIDWGNMNWVVVVGRNENGLTYVIGIFIAADTQVEMESTRRIINYIKPFKPNVIIADAGYGKDRNAAVLRTFGPDKFWRCEYNPSPKSSKTFNPVWQPAQNSVMVDRTMTLKETTRSVREQEVGLPNPSDDKVMLLRKHLLNLVPFLEEEEGEFVETVRKLGDDHLSHCLAYALLGQSRIEGTRKFNFDFVETRS